MSKFAKIGLDVGKLVDFKNKIYGDSVLDAPKVFEILYPDGIKVEQYGDVLLLVRVFDKMKRIATKKDALGESPWGDLAGYSVLGIYKDIREKKNKPKKKIKFKSKK